MFASVQWQRHKYRTLTIVKCRLHLLCVFPPSLNRKYDAWHRFRVEVDFLFA